MFSARRTSSQLTAKAMTLGTAPFMIATRQWLTVTTLKMPSLSPTMEKGGLAEWVKKVGDPILPGDVFCKVETDKATVAFENSAEEGFLARIIVPSGTKDVGLGDVIALIVDEKSGVNAPEVLNWQPKAKAAAAAPAAAAPAAAAAPVAAPAASAAAGGRVFASPLAKNVAKELGISLQGVAGTGGAIGRITKEDVLKAAANGTAGKAGTASSAAEGAATAQPSAAPSTPATASKPAPAANANFVDEPTSNMRRVIAQRLTQSKQEVPHYIVSLDCNAGNMTKLIKHLNEKGAGAYKITVNDFIVKAIARANLLVPQANTHWYGDFLRRYSTVDVSVAVATPTGLITPIIRDAHVKGLAQISQETKELAKRAREGTLQPTEYIGGTVTVSNMGGLGVDHFTAIINPPQSTIIAVGTARPRPEIIKNAEGEFEATGKIETVINFTASFDHRVVDGAVGAEWFKHFKDTVENPLSLLL